MCRGSSIYRMNVLNFNIYHSCVLFHRVLLSKKKKTFSFANILHNILNEKQKYPFPYNYCSQTISKVVSVKINISNQFTIYIPWTESWT